MASDNAGTWDQFAVNERLFGIKTNYDESFYTTTIDKSHPQYRERMAAAERKAREIERSTAATSHVAEERVMDFVGGDDRDEEEKCVSNRLGLYQTSANISIGTVVYEDNRIFLPWRRHARTSIHPQLDGRQLPTRLSKELQLIQLSSRHN